MTEDVFLISLEVQSQIATMRFQRLDKANAVPCSAWPTFKTLADRAVELGARALILRSDNPQFFSSGVDIDELADFVRDKAAVPRFRHDMRVGLQALRALPSVAIVESGCYGAGVALMMACDVRVAGPNAHFAITPARLGISYPQEDVARLVELVGRGQAARLLYGAEKIDAIEAVRIGLVEMSAVNAVECAERWASAVASNAQSSLKELRLALDGVSGDDGFDAAFGNTDFEERIKAFRMRRR